MQEIAEFFSKLFSGEDWPARWHCGRWSEFHGWLYIISDLLIWSAYFTIPVIILKFALRKKNLKFYSAYLWFAAFILFCGATHLVDAVIFWLPLYRVAALLRFMTAVASWITIYHLFKMLPTALNLKTVSQFEAEIERGNELLRELRSNASELIKQKNFSETIVSASIDYVLVFDRDLNILMLNKKTEKLLSKKVEELKGKNFLQLFPDYRDSDYHINVRMAVTGQLIQDVISLSVTGRYYTTNFIPLEHDGKPYAALVVARDITETLEKEKALQNLNNSLREQNNKLHNANQELEQFAYILSHDLQEPLRKIQIFSKLLIEKNNKGDFNDNNAYLSKMDNSARRMKTLIEDVLEYSRTNAGATFVICNLNELLAEAVSDLELMINEKQAKIVAQTLPTIECIPHQIQQTFYNILNNSLKYSQSEPLIEIRFIEDIDVYGKKVARISIKDNGIGFDNDFREEIFSIFKRLQNRQDYPGTGIGLSLVKKIAENHGGSIRAESEPGKGSVFILTLPLKQT